MMPRPFLSVVVPAHNGAKVLPHSLGALVASDLSRDSWELIVVDDGSTDDTAERAARYADVVVRLPGSPHGPAYARNRGVEASCGDVVVFLDADVCAHPDTLRRFSDIFAAEPGVSAVFGSYDAQPPAPGTVSQYRNLLHHYVHQQSPGDAETFWAGCGAIRTRVFSEAGKYDEWHFPRPQIEDIELGHRIRALGYRIVLHPEIQATHLKHWTLSNVILTDLNDRGVPWTRLLIQQGNATRLNVLNLRAIEKINTALVGLSLLAVLVAVLRWDPLWLLLSGLLVTPVLVSNRPLYRFFERERGFWFAVRALPLHLMYYFLNGISAAWGWLLHHTVGAPAPRPEVQAFAEVGVRTWPPVPQRAKGSVWYQPGD